MEDFGFSLASEEFRVGVVQGLRGLGLMALGIRGCRGFGVQRFSQADP